MAEHAPLVGVVMARWFELPVLRHTPLARQRQEDEDYAHWMERPEAEWPRWVDRRWQAERYAEDGY